MKIYAASLIGTKPTSGSVIETTLVFSLPALIPAESMQEAAERCRQHCLERWKPEDGFHTWQAALMPVTEAFYDAAFQAHNDGILDMADEPGQTFNFTPEDGLSKGEGTEWPDLLGE